MSNEITDVSYSSSKPELWKAVKELKSQIDSAPSVTSTTEVAQKAKVEGAVKTASTVDITSVSATVTSLVAQISNAKDQYSDIVTAIEAKKTELKDIHGIEAEANTFVAIVATKERIVSEKEEEAKAIIATANDTATSIISDAQDQKSSVLSAISETKKADTQSRTREIEEWDYKFARQKQSQTDALQDVLDAKVKVISVRETEVSERESLVDEKDTKIMNLSDNINELNESINIQIDEAVVKAKKGSETSHNIAKAMISKEHSAETSIKDARIETLEEKVTEITLQLANANVLIADANNKVASMATSALKAQADAATVTELTKIAASSGKTGR